MLGWLDRTLNREAWRPAARKAAGVLALVVLLGFWRRASPPCCSGFCRRHGRDGCCSCFSPRACRPSAASTSMSALSRMGWRLGLESGRAAVGMIVGRNTAVLDEAGVSRAAIESLAENFSDGIVAPVVLDGARRPRRRRGLQGRQHRRQHDRPQDAPAIAAFGWAAARLRRPDQPARVAARGGLDRARGRRAARRFGRERPGARSGATRRGTARPMPAGRRRRWPARSASSSPARASMATRWWTTPTWATGGARPTRRDIRRALALYRLSCAIQLVALAAMAVRARQRARLSSRSRSMMRFEMRGERVQRVLDIGLVARSRRARLPAIAAMRRAGGHRRTARGHTRRAPGRRATPPRRRVHRRSAARGARGPRRWSRRHASRSPRTARRRRGSCR